MKELIKIQKELKAPKNQRNKFGNYNYRSCEDILEALKPHLAENNCTLTISDEIIHIDSHEKSPVKDKNGGLIGYEETGIRTYVKATATIYNSENISLSVSASAREPMSKKGMDESQITGAASSYARKYALNGLFLIDDTKDSDNPTGDDKWESLIKKLKDAKNVADVKEVWDNNPKLQSNKKFKDEVNKAKARYENS